MLIKIPIVFFVEIDKLSVKFLRLHKGLILTKTILKEVGILTLQDINTIKLL